MAITPEQVKNNFEEYKKMSSVDRIQRYIDIRLSDPVWITDMKIGYDEYFYYKFTVPEVIDDSTRDKITNIYLKAGWGTVSISGKVILLYNVPRREYEKNLERYTSHLDL